MEPSLDLSHWPRQCAQPAEDPCSAAACLDSGNAGRLRVDPHNLVSAAMELVHDVRGTARSPCRVVVRCEAENGSIGHRALADLK